VFRNLGSLITAPRLWGRTNNNTNFVSPYKQGLHNKNPRSVKRQSGDFFDF